MKLAFSTILLFLFTSNISWGQSLVEIRKDLNQYKVYSSIEEALTNPEAVYRLNLNNNKLRLSILKNFMILIIFMNF